MRFRLALAAALGVLFCENPCFSAYQYGFGDMSMNRLYWSDDTRAKAPEKVDFNYLELEGGAQFTWGETYGFFDIENIFKSDAEHIRSAGKAVLRYYIPGNSGFSIYAHVYDFNSKGFSEENRVIGLGYQFQIPHAWLKPFLGVHDVTQTYFSGLNGFMGGWVVGYDFKIQSQEFQLTDWHELQFDREPGYAMPNGGSVGQNGAAAAWWNISPSPFTVGIQWRYAFNNLGTPGWVNAAIVTFRYGF